MNESSIKGRRAELLVEAFLDDLKPSRFVKAESPALDFDFVVAFKKPSGGLKYCAIEVKQTEKPIRQDFRFLTRRGFVETSKSNMPTVILIADTKQNELYYSFASKAKISNTTYKTGLLNVVVPVKKAGFSLAEKRQFISDVLAN